jgi:glycosyltransferase involved in cell wall biosynthesis
MDGFAHQTVPKDDFEIIVVDDGSTQDVGRSVAGFERELNLRLIRTDQAGPGAARNLAINQARGELVLLYDDDLRPSTDIVEYCLEFHRDHPEEGAMALLQFGPDPEIARSLFEAWAFRTIYAFPREAGVYGWACFWSGTLTLKKSLFRYGLFDAGYRMLEDAELGLRLSRNVDIRVHYEPRLTGSFTRRLTMQQIYSRQYTVGYYTHVFARQYRGAVNFDYAPYDQPEKYVVRDARKLKVLTSSVLAFERFGDDRDRDKAVQGSRAIRALWSAAERHARADGWIAARDGRPAEPPGSLGPLLTRRSDDAPL